MADARRVQVAQGFPYAGRARRFAGMGGHEQAMLMRVIESRLVRSQRECGFVARDVEGHDPRAAEALDQLRGLHALFRGVMAQGAENRSEEHTSELQSPDHLVCRLLLEKKKKKK